MKLKMNTSDLKLRSWVVIDVESAVTDEPGHQRYQAMERWTPRAGQQLRRGYRRHEDPLTCPRWPFQTIVAAAIMILVEHEDGNVDVTRFTTLSAPDLNEQEIVKRILRVLADAPDGAELASWAGMLHDVPMISMACMRHGLTLPRGWGWLSFGGNDPVRHLDFARTSTGGFKMKPVHMSEVLATLDIPAKITVPAFAVARLIYDRKWDAVCEAVENDVISTALLLAHWRQSHDGRAELGVVKDRILRRVEELRAGRSYIPVLSAYRAKLFDEKCMAAGERMDSLAPWLKDAA